MADRTTGADERSAATVARLADDVGTWDTELEITPYPGAPVNRTTGVAINRLVGGVWLVTDQSTESGFEGHGVYGWDPGAGCYVATWVDVGGAGMARGTGTWNEAERSMTYEFQVDLASGDTVHYREVTQVVDDGTRTYRNLMPTPDRSEHEVIRATFRRR